MSNVQNVQRNWPNHKLWSIAGQIITAPMNLSTEYYRKLGDHKLTKYRKAVQKVRWQQFTVTCAYYLVFWHNYIMFVYAYIVYTTTPIRFIIVASVVCFVFCLFHQHHTADLRIANNKKENFLRRLLFHLKYQMDHIYYYPKL